MNRLNKISCVIGLCLFCLLVLTPYALAASKKTKKPSLVPPPFLCSEPIIIVFNSPSTQVDLLRYEKCVNAYLEEMDACLSRIADRHAEVTRQSKRYQMDNSSYLYSLMLYYEEGEMERRHALEQYQRVVDKAKAQSEHEKQWGTLANPTSPSF